MFSRARTCVLAAISFCFLLTPIVGAEPEKLSIYAPQAKFTVPVLELDGRPYVGIFEVVEPLGSPELRQEGHRWRLKVPNPNSPGRSFEAEFQDGSAKARIRGQNIILSAPAHAQTGHLLVPLRGIGSILIPILGTNILFHESGRRLFIGGSAQPLTAEIHDGDTLQLHFQSSVNPTVSTEGDSLKLTFTRDPVTSLNEAQQFSSKTISSANYVERNGSATITVNGRAPLLARFADGGKTIIVSAAPGLPAAANMPAQAPAAAASPAPAATTPNAQPQSPDTAMAKAPQPPTFLVVIDPGHGGADSGARIAPTLLEKDLTLSFARALRQELQARHIAVKLLRDADTDLTLDQRAVATNLARPSVFISVHAEPGATLHVFTPALPSPASALDRKSFLPWDSAQSAYTADSTGIAVLVSGALVKHNVSAQMRISFLQPLRSIAAPSIALELPAGEDGIAVSSQSVVASVADAISFRRFSVANRGGQ